ncbi:spermatogenesis-associated protein 7 homolog isoform X2 [Mauremys mutica]|uniref:Spermatogenesis associated 7 n=1 Tax=Mauremys mutica TaxID=74926 RepID=A0A9D3X2L8_9SAUR|nr:spermatogenesis-associated protein 7 homolog isoform X2 [Mauremys mutica]KAH1172669.1 hypothetical protein KIL84_016508 [Mauremys mutica]
MAAAGAAPAGSQLAMVPKYSMMGPFRGHMSIKSSPFSPGSSSKLSTQYIIQDHMATHYRKLLSSKAAVDSSVPKSLHTSIKYRDQQKKERLIKAVEKYKKELVRIVSSPKFNCRSVSMGQQKWPDKSRLYLAPRGKVCSMTQEEQHSSVPFKKPPSRIPSPVLTARETIRDIVQQSLSQTPVHRSNMLKLSTTPHSQAHLCAVVCSRKPTFQDPQKKTYSGDLLDKHSDWFTEKNQPFAPQILKTSRQSFLSKYRYYNPPHKMKSISPGRPSLRSTGTYSVRPRELCSSVEDAHLRSDADYSMRHPVKEHELWFMKPQTPHSLRSQFKEKEEELKYLQFLQEVTNDILIRSCYCKEAIEDIFQMHIRSRRHDLDEVKMRRLFQDLKDELNCTYQLDPSISYTGIQHSDTSTFKTCL